MLKDMFDKHLTIGFDIDDTITNSYIRIMNSVSIHYNIDINEIIDNGYGYDYFIYNQELFPDYIEFVRGEFEKILYDVELKEGAKEAINLLHSLGHNIVFITARSNEEYSDPYQFTLDYLNRNDIMFDKLIVNVKDKGKCAIDNNIDLFIDDSIDNCTKTRLNGIYSVLVDNSFNRRDRSFERLFNYNDLIEIINNSNNVL